MSVALRSFRLTPSYPPTQFGGDAFRSGTVERAVNVYQSRTGAFAVSGVVLEVVQYVVAEVRNREIPERFRKAPAGTTGTMRQVGLVDYRLLRLR